MPRQRRSSHWGGLTLDDARRLLSSRGLHLEQEVIDELHALTAGNAQFLTLAVNILTQAADPVLLLERLSQTNDIERYLLTAVDEGLSGAERSVMGAVSVLLGYPGTRDAVEAVLNAGNVWRTLRLLHERHLLTVTEGEAGREYNQHAIVQGFYYQELGRRQRRVMHQRAGEFYEAEEIDLLRSGIHYERAAAYELAARQATADVWVIINRGQARVLRRLLERFRTDQLPPEQWAEVNIAKGTNYAFLDEREKENESYQRALADLEGLSLSERVVELKARICRGMGELLELENPQEALSWLERGLDELGDENQTESAALSIKAGTAEMYLGEYDAALELLQKGLMQLPDAPTQLRSAALLSLAGVCFFQGNLDLASVYSRQALDVSQQLHNHFQTVNILIGIGIERFCAGNWKRQSQNLSALLIWHNHWGVNGYRRKWKLISVQPISIAGMMNLHGSI